MSKFKIKNLTLRAVGEALLGFLAGSGCFLILLKLFNFFAVPNERISGLGALLGNVLGQGLWAVEIMMFGVFLVPILLAVGLLFYFVLYEKHPFIIYGFLLFAVTSIVVGGFVLIRKLQIERNIVFLPTTRDFVESILVKN